MIAKEKFTLQSFDCDDAAASTAEKKPGEPEASASRSRAMDAEIMHPTVHDEPSDDSQAAGREPEPDAGPTLHRGRDSAALYFGEMRRVPPLAPEQETEVCRRIERAELNALERIECLGFTAHAYVRMARKLMEGGVRFDQVVVIRHVGCRETYLRQLPELCVEVEQLAANCSAAYASGLAAEESLGTGPAFADFAPALAALREVYPKFLFRQRVIEEFVESADEAHRIVSLALAGAPRAEQRAGKKPSSHPCRRASVPVGPDLAAMLKQQQMRTWLSPEKFLVVYQELKMWLKKAHAAKGELIEANLRLVVSIAKRYTFHGQPMLDLIQEGNIGLMKAIDRFDYRQGNRFSTYATWWIREQISESISGQMRMIRIPAHMIETITKLGRVQRELAQEYGRDATPAEIAGEVQLPVERVQEVLDMAQQPISLHLPAGNDDGSTIGDFVIDETVECPSETVSRASLKARLKGMLETLSKRERLVLEHRFGLLDGTSLTLDEIGRRFNVSGERIRQIEAAALRKMRQPRLGRELAGFRNASQLAGRRRR